MRVGYSYIRYSAIPQGAGDSVERQTRGAAQWCARHGATLDQSRSYQALGQSAFRGKHRARGGALATFLAEVESGRIPSGSVLIVENLDRLSRESPWDSLPLLIGIVNAGIQVVTLSPTEMTYQRGSDLTPLMLALVEFGRGHSESETKSHRQASAWNARRKAVRAGNGTIFTRQLPKWITVRDGKLSLIPERLAAIRRVFALAVAGYGLSRIVKALSDERVPTFGKARCWSKRYVHKIVSGRVVLGEFQPRIGTEPDGAPIPGYFPACIDEATWLQAQAAMARRKTMPGPLGQTCPALFGGLLYDAITQDKMRITWQTARRGSIVYRHRLIVSARSEEGAAPVCSFPHEAFEQGILRMLREVDPRDVLGQDAQSESATLASQLAAREAKALAVEHELLADEADVAILARVARKLDAECQHLRRQLAEARVKESHPIASALVEAKSLAALATDEHTRLRLRELLRQIITEAWVLVVPRESGYRLACVQISFREGPTRHYLILHRQATHHRRGEWWANSLSATLVDARVDLRDRVKVLAFRTELEEQPIATLLAALGEPTATAPPG